MDKITNKKNNILRICAGNDFSIVVQITEYDTEASAWVNYDLSAVSDVHMSLIAENGKHIKLPVTVNSNGTVSAAIQSAYLQKTTYGIEITWLTDSLNRRTYSPCLLQIVTSTAESSSNIAEYDSNDAYHFNIKMMADVAILSIGKISDEYITESELADELLNYATNSSVETQISTLWNDVNDTFVDNNELATSLDNYVTNDNLSSMSYVETSHLYDNIYTKSEVDTKDANERNYVNGNFYNMTQVDNMLTNYVNDAEYDSTNHNILLKNGSTTLVTIDASPFIIDGMVDDVEVSNGYLVISFNTDAGKQDISIPISDIFDANNYYTKTEVDAALANIDLSNYVTTSDLTTTLADYALDSDMTAAEADITSLDGRVTTLEQNPSVPSNVVTSDDGNEIVCLTQSEYDTLEQNQQLDPDVFYYITDATSNYVSQSDLTNYVTQTQLNTAISGVTIDETNIVHLTGTETITGTKTFTANNTFNGDNTLSGETKFIFSTRGLNYTDNLSGLSKSSLFARGSFNQACIGQILAPNTAVSDLNNKYDNQVNTILFQKVDGNTGSPYYRPTSLTTLAKIDSNGIYEGTTLLANKYVQSTNIRNMIQISQSDYDTLVNNSQVDANTLYIIL